MSNKPAFQIDQAVQLVNPTMPQMDGLAGRVTAIIAPGAKSPNHETEVYGTGVEEQFYYWIKLDEGYLPNSDSLECDRKFIVGRAESELSKIG